jgi:hypothetical protein
MRSAVAWAELREREKMALSDRESHFKTPGWDKEVSVRAW